MNAEDKTLQHDLLLLMLNLSQLKDHHRIIRLFLEALNSRKLGITLDHVDRLSPEHILCENVVTQKSNFGSIVYKGEVEASIPEILPLIRNAVRILALILEHRQLEIDLTREKTKVEDEAKKRNEIMLRSAIDGFWIVDLQGRIMEVNDAYCAMVGYTRDSLLTMNVKDLETQESPEDIQEHINRIKTGGAHRFESRHKCADGRVLDLEISANYLDIDGGLIFTFFRDITERKQAEEKLKRSRNQFAVTFNASPTVMSISTVKNGRLIEVNQAFCDVLGYDREELIGRTSIEMNLYANPDDRSSIKEGLMRDGRVSDMEVRVKTRANAIRTFLYSCQPIEIEGEPCILSTANDITERKEAEEEKAKLESQLHQAQKMEAVGQLAGGVAHDFNNILTTILGNVELSIDSLKKELGPDHILLQRLLEIDRGAKRASTLTRQLLAFSRRQVAQPTILDLNLILSEMEKMLRRLITEEIVFETCLAPNLHKVRADAGQMEQVLMNLVVNARDAMPDGGNLTIETENLMLDETYCETRAEVEPGDYVMLAVSDTGVGMHPHIVWRIFEPFYTTKPTGEGTGLGLSTVYGIVKQSHGHIGVYSEPGQGSTFKIFLPALEKSTLKNDLEPDAMSWRKTDDETIKSGSETILVAEDDDHVRGLLVLMLESAGYRVLPALNGAQAISMAKETDEEIDLLITDVIMPDMNGKILTDTLAGLRPGIRTLYISGYTSNVIAHHGVIDEGIEFLSKPFTRTKLLARVREVLEQETRA